MNRANGLIIKISFSLWRLAWACIDRRMSGEKPFKWVSKLTHFRKLFIHTYDDRCGGVVVIGWFGWMNAQCIYLKYVEISILKHVAALPLFMNAPHLTPYILLMYKYHCGSAASELVAARALFNQTCASVVDLRAQHTFDVLFDTTQIIFFGSQRVNTLLRRHVLPRGHI